MIIKYSLHSDTGKNYFTFLGGKKIKILNSQHKNVINFNKEFKF